LQQNPQGERGKAIYIDKGVVMVRVSGLYQNITRAFNTITFSAHGELVESIRVVESTVFYFKLLAKIPRLKKSDFPSHLILVL